MLRWISCRTLHLDLAFTLTKKKLRNSIHRVFSKSVKMLLNTERERRTTCRICQSRAIARISLKSPSSSQILTLTTIFQLRHQILSKAVLWQIRVEVLHFQGVKAPKRLLRNSKCMKQSLIVQKKDQLNAISCQRTGTDHEKRNSKTNHSSKSQRTWRMKEAMQGISQLVGSHQSTRMESTVLKRRRYRKSLDDSRRRPQAWCMKAKSELLTDFTLRSKLHTTRSKLPH